jgi:hypothetical protein
MMGFGIMEFICIDKGWVLGLWNLYELIKDGFWDYGIIGGYWLG